MLSQRVTGKVLNIIDAAKLGLIEPIALAISQKANLNLMIGKRKLTALHYAAMNGDIKIVEILVIAGAQIDARDSKGWTSVHWAAYKGHTNIINYLAYHNADIYTSNDKGWNALHLATFNGHTETVFSLTVNHKMNVGRVTEDSKQTASMIAKQRNFDELGKLINQHNTTSIREAYNNFWKSAQHSNKERLLETIHQGVNVNERYEAREYTALHLAALTGNIEILDLLLQTGAKIDTPDKEGWTALHFTAKNGHTLAVDFLVSRGANVCLTDNEGWNALHKAATRGFTETAIKLITKHNMDIFQKTTNTQRTAREIAKTWGFDKLAKTLELYENISLQAMESRQQPIPGSSSSMIASVPFAPASSFIQTTSSTSFPEAPASSPTTFQSSLDLLTFPQATPDSTDTPLPHPAKVSNGKITKDVEGRILSISIETDTPLPHPAKVSNEKITKDVEGRILSISIETEVKTISEINPGLGTNLTPDPETSQPTAGMVVIRPSQTSLFVAVPQPSAQAQEEVDEPFLTSTENSPNM